jgi:hypothetical protein
MEIVITGNKYLQKWEYAENTCPNRNPCCGRPVLLNTVGQGFSTFPDLGPHTPLSYGLAGHKIINTVGKVFLLEYTDIPKLFSMPHHTSHCSTNETQGHCCAVGHFCTNVIWGQQCDPTMITLPTVVWQWVPTVGIPVPLLQKKCDP